MDLEEFHAPTPPPLDLHSIDILLDVLSYLKDRDGMIADNSMWDYVETYECFAF